MCVGRNGISLGSSSRLHLGHSINNLRRHKKLSYIAFNFLFFPRSVTAKAIHVCHLWHDVKGFTIRHKIGHPKYAIAWLVSYLTPPYHLIIVT
jgi:hypothetical protein